MLNPFGIFGGSANVNQFLGYALVAQGAYAEGDYETAEYYSNMIEFESLGIADNITAMFGGNVGFQETWLLNNYGVDPDGNFDPNFQFPQQQDSTGLLLLGVVLYLLIK